MAQLLKDDVEWLKNSPLISEQTKESIIVEAMFVYRDRRGNGCLLRAMKQHWFVCSKDHEDENLWISTQFSNLIIYSSHTEYGRNELHSYLRPHRYLPACRKYSVSRKHFVHLLILSEFVKKTATKMTTFSRLLCAASSTTCLSDTFFASSLTVQLVSFTLSSIGI